MNGVLGRAGARVVLGLCALTACGEAPRGTEPGATAAAGSVVEKVRLATDRTGTREEIVTLPSGERLRRVASATAYSHVLVAKVGADGKPSITCVDSAPAAESFLAAPADERGQ